MWVRHDRGMIPIVTPAEMAVIDSAAREPVEVLIERAGAAVARTAIDLLGGTYGRRVVVVAGKGNNGRDGIAAARRLERRGVRTMIIDAATTPEVLPEADLIIDAAYGTGFRGRWQAPRPADVGTPILAVDIPSGVSGLTGAASGSPFRADVTVTFAAYKPGLLVGDGPALSGRVIVADIGLDTDAARSAVLTAADVAEVIPRRHADAHKWKQAVWLIAGSPGMTGSARLAAAAALRTGAGYVRLSIPGVPAETGDPIEAVRHAIPAHHWAPTVAGDIGRFGALAVGPGLGATERDGRAVTHRGTPSPGNELSEDIAEILATSTPIVVDGDGLRALGDDPRSILSRRPPDAPPVVLTPHEGEFIRLGGRLDTSDPGFDRFDAVRALAGESGAVVLLKGAVTIVAHPDGRTRVVHEGDARLATAGTGDVLTGVVAALLAGGMPPLEAAAAAAWVHGRAGLLGPPRGLVASDLPGAIPTVLESLPVG